MTVRTPAWAFLAFVAAFILYGSLFPFDFRAAPEPFAMLLARHALFANVADATDNFLLFVPLGLALHLCLPRPRDRLIGALLALLALGLGVQALQLYLPSRTAALADVVWNAAGLTAGLLVAGLARRWLGARFAVSRAAQPFPLLLVLLWFVYESFPFVPTLDYGLLRAHVKTALIAPPFEAMRFVEHLLAALLAGLALQRACLFERDGPAVALLGAGALLLEILVAYGSLRRETLLGMLAGLALGYLLGRSGDPPARIALAAAAASALLIAVLTPYRGQAADAGFTLTPFSGFLWHHVTYQIPPLAFEALAIGALLWAGLWQGGQTGRRAALRVGAVVGLVAALEAVRVLVAGYRGDTTALLMAALLGAFALGCRPAGGAPAGPDRQGRGPGPLATFLAHPVVAIALLAAAVYAAARLPGMPYNVRELFPAGSGGIGAALVLAGCVWLAARSPFLLLVPQARRRLLLFPLLLGLQGVILWALLRWGVPRESLHDIVGAPVLGWPWDWELLLRFLALHQAVATQMVGAVFLVALVCRPALLPALLWWLVVGLLCAWPLHLVIVEGAVTDNLTELMRGGGSLSASTLLALGLLSVCLGGAALGAAIALPERRRALLAIAAATLPLAAACFHAGLEPTIVKYGQVFSAGQFLLSPDRANYLSPAALTMRFVLAWALAAALIALLQLRAWQSLAPCPEQRPHPSA